MLTVKTNLNQNAELRIHPNEGFDIGLMNTSNNIKFTKAGNQPMKQLMERFYWIITVNRVLLKLIMKFWKKIGKPAKIVLFYDNNSIKIENF